MNKMNNDKKTWIREGYEVHTSTDGENWRGGGGGQSPRRPSFNTNELTKARAHVKSIAKDHRHVRLVKLKMDFTLVDSTTCAKTDSEQKTEILAKARELFKDDPAVDAHECSFMSMDTMNLSASQVRIQCKQAQLGFGPCPKRVDYKNIETRVIDEERFKTDVTEWGKNVKAADKVKAEEIATKLKAAGIPFCRRTYYDWVIFRLA